MLQSLKKGNLKRMKQNEYGWCSLTKIKMFGELDQQLNRKEGGSV